MNRRAFIGLASLVSLSAAAFAGTTLWRGSSAPKAPGCCDGCAPACACCTGGGCACDECACCDDGSCGNRGDCRNGPCGATTEKSVAPQPLSEGCAMPCCAGVN